MHPLHQRLSKLAKRFDDTGDFAAPTDFRRLGLRLGELKRFGELGHRENPSPENASHQGDEGAVPAQPLELGETK
jgi:hypothetical protein